MTRTRRWMMRRAGLDWTHDETYKYQDTYVLGFACNGNYSTMANAAVSALL